LTAQVPRLAGIGAQPALPPPAPPLPLPTPPAPPPPTTPPTQTLFVHVSPALQSLPHMPQLVASDARLTHAAPQVVLGLEHVDVHIPLTQKGVAPVHGSPHWPQFVVLDFVSVQTPEHTIPAHCTGAAPLEPPLPAPPGELPLPALPPGFCAGEPAEQLIASTAEHPSVSEAPTNFARNELDFGRNRFHIRAPNLKVRRLRSKGCRGTPLLAQLDLLQVCSHCSALKRKGKDGEINALAEIAAQSLIGCSPGGKNSSQLPTNSFRAPTRVALSTKM